MCTVGASGPREMLAQTPQQVPTNFTSSVLQKVGLSAVQACDMIV